MKPSSGSRGWVLPAACVAFFTAIPALADQVVYLGDAEWDYSIDSADVIRVERALADPGSLPGMSLLLADANNDFAIDANDVIYVMDIVLGLAEARPLAARVVGRPVSFDSPPDAEDLSTSENLDVADVSFYYPTDPAGEATESNALERGAPSFLYLEAIAPQVIEQNTVQRTTPSFLYLEAIASQVTEQNTVPRGTPSFLYLSAIETLVNETNATERGTPSFDRQ